MRQDIYVETDEPAGHHQGPQDVVLAHGLPNTWGFGPHQLTQHLLLGVMLLLASVQQRVVVAWVLLQLILGPAG
ncbi:hypothetical protein UPYG_G00017190 [Umbra pygmaea]|uniref:Uncharacterized protein n=1 Tax=Umbra pygmaea TaxID=75934 RepID=A0ABD0XJX2_UMBPY